jgi:superfamily II DNA or RNA helicase
LIGKGIPVVDSEKIIISKVNDVYISIDCERNIAKELHEHFSFYVPGFQFTPKFKNKLWDGKIKLFSLKNNYLYYGLLRHVKEFAESREYEIVFSDGIDYEDDFSVYHAKKFFDSLNLQSNGVVITPNDHQLDAFVHSMQSRRSLLLSPTASGKSLIIYLLFRQFLDFQGLKGLIIVPSTGLVEQLFSDFEDYSSNNDFNVDSNVHRIYQGMEKNSTKQLYISTWQSLYRMPSDYFEQFDYVIGDEAHLFKADSLTTILTSCTNTKYRIGLTGTLSGMKTHQLVLEGLFGVVKQVTTTKDLMDAGIVSDFEIKCLILRHPDESCKCIKGKEYSEEMEYLILNESRNKFIRNLAISLEKNTLILFQMVDKHGKILYNLIKGAEKIGNRKVFFVHGKIDTEDRESIRRIMETETDAIVIASYGTFSTGTNIKNLHNVIFASPSKSKVRVLQSIGRTLRLFSGKTKATLFDIADDLRVGDKMNHTLKHFVQRAKIYTEEKFSFKTYKIGLKK